MTIEEYAHFSQMNGEKVVRYDDVWWKEVRRFFYRPLFPFLELKLHEKKPPRNALIGGYQHLVPQDLSRADATGNSFMNFLIFDDCERYSLEQLKHNHRSNIKKGMRYFTIKEVVDKDEFVRNGYSAYMSFYARTGYDYKKERRDKESFARWANTLFSSSKILKLGAYEGNEISAIHISYRVGDVVILATFFSKTEALRLRVTDAMMHALRERAVTKKGIQCMFAGLVTGQKGLDESKQGYGCKVVSRRAFHGLNPLSRFLIRNFMPSNYRKLLGQPMPLAQQL
jgi:hypothetical protein